MHSSKRPDLFGFVEGPYAPDLIAAEVKDGAAKLEDIYQAKLYKDVLGARYGFLITTKPIPEEVMRLYGTTPAILRSVGDSIYGFLAIGEFDKETQQVKDWFEENPFEQKGYWK